MAALTGITAVRPTSNTIQDKYLMGATVAPGQPIYLDTAAATHKLAANTSITLAKVNGIAITSGVATGYAYIARGGSIELVGTTMAVGDTYYLGAAGEIVPASDVTTGKLVTRLGEASAATILDLSIKATGIVHA